MADMKWYQGRSIRWRTMKFRWLICYNDSIHRWWRWSWRNGLKAWWAGPFYMVRIPIRREV